MDQISPPMRIVLVVAVVFLAAWMLVLKPKDEAVEPAATPATPATASAQDDNQAGTSLGKAVESARGAKDAVEAKQDQEAAASGEATTNAPNTTSAASPSAKDAPAKPTAKPADPALAKLPTWLQDSMDKKVVAILFSNDKAADDRRTRRALSRAFHAHGQVVTRAVPITKIARYRPVAQGVDVQQSPTLMVIDRDRGANALVGFSGLRTINQAIVDGLLATDVPVKHVKFLQTVRRECHQTMQQSIVGDARGDDPADARKNINGMIAQLAGSGATLRNAPAPARYRPLKRLVNRHFSAQLAAFKRSEAAVGPKGTDPIRFNRAFKGTGKLSSRTTLELNAVGIDACN